MNTMEEKSHTSSETPPRSSKSLVSLENENENESQSLSTCNNSKASSNLQNSKRLSGFYSTGRDFYDDNYENSDSSEGENSIEDTLDFGHPVADFRREELATLHKAYKQASHNTKQTKKQQQPNKKPQNPNAPSISLIMGLSGTGKSTLFRQFVSEVQSNSTASTPQVLTGKFEELSGENPLGALVEAFASLALPYSASASETTEQRDDLRQLRQRIIRKLGGRKAAEALANLLPALKPLLQPVTAPRKASNPDASCTNNEDVPDEKSQRTHSTGESPLPTKSSNENAWNQLKFRLQTIFQAICSDDKVTILFIDDLQWIDDGTIDILEMILLDDSIEKFMFVGSYRSDYTVPDNFWKLMEASVDHGSTISNIETKNLTRDEMVLFVQRTLRMSAPETEEEELQRTTPLAGALHGKTDGNLFFARQILEEMYAKGWISFSRVTFTWEWDVEQIDISDNVLEAVSRRIRTDCSYLLQRILITAAYMRSTVDADSLMLAADLDTLVSKENANDTGGNRFKPLKQRLIEELDTAVTSGFLTNMTGSNDYSFAHDRIKQAAYDMVEEGPERHQFRRAIANRLYRISKDKRLGRDWMVYAAADHFNATPQADSLFLANVNLEAGRRCVRVASFKVASKYLSQALQYLASTSDPWQYYYKLSLEIHCLKAESDALLGNLEECRKIAKIVFAKAKCEEDTYGTRLIVAKALGRKESHTEAFEMCRQTLRSMGYYPKSKYGLIVRLIQDNLYVRRYIKKHTNDEILALPRSEDKTFNTALELLGVIIYQAYFAGRPLDFLAATVISLRLSLARGLCTASSGAFTAYLFVSDELYDHEFSVRLANLGTSILEQFADKTALCLQILSISIALGSWSVESKHTIAAYRKAYKIGMELGDFENASIGNALLLEHQFSLGYPLGPLDVQYRDLLSRQKVLQVGPYQESTKGQWEPIKYLRGSVDDLADVSSPLPVSQVSSRLDFDRLDQNKIAQAFHFRSSLMMGVYWNDLNFLEKVVQFRGKIPDKSHCLSAMRLSFLAIAYGTLYQQGKNAKASYLKKGRKCASDLKALSERKGMISWHRQVLAAGHLEATSDRKRYSKGNKADYILRSTINRYEEAIELAANCNCMQDAALGAQLLAQQILWKHKDPEPKMVTKYLLLARTWYKEWGATNLVRHLDQKYDRFITKAESEAFSIAAPMVSKEEIKLFSSNENGAANNGGSIIVTEKARDDCSTVTDRAWT